MYCRLSCVKTVMILTPAIALGQDTNEPVKPNTIFEIVKDGHGKGRDLAIVTWKTKFGTTTGVVKAPITGNGRIGPVSLKLRVLGSIPNAYEWDTREWQWWKDYPFDLNQMRPREVAPARGGGDTGPGGVRIWTRFVCDDIETVQEWFFADLAQIDHLSYDCVITVRSLRKNVLEQYGQFFASYTAWNGENGHFYWNADGKLVNYKDVGSRHLDYYVTAAGSMFHKLGRVPHCPRGGGNVRATWKHPVSVSLSNSNGYRHVLMTEERRTAAIAQGMRGIAQDFLIYPTDAQLRLGEKFRVHVRHLIVKVSEKQLPEQLKLWWSKFAGEHQRFHKLSRPVNSR